MDTGHPVEEAPWSENDVARLGTFFSQPQS